MNFSILIVFFSPIFLLLSNAVNNNSYLIGNLIFLTFFFAEDCSAAVEIT
jgi:hypothetical protein